MSPKSGSQAEELNSPESYITSSEKNAKTHEIRAERLSEMTQHVAMEVLVDGKPAELLNLSETGIAIQTASRINVDHQIQLKLQFDANRVIFEGPIVVVWEREVSAGYRFGARFSSHLLSEALPHALEAVGQIHTEVEATRTETERLPAELKVLVIDIKTYLIALKTRLDGIEKKLLPYSHEVKKSHRKAVELWISPQVVDQLQRYNMRLFNMLPLFTTPEQRNAAISLFRSELGLLMLNTPFTERAWTKPRGYAGDFEMMNQVYRDEHEGSSLYEQVIHKYSVNEASTRSVRYRKEMMVRRFKELAKEKAGKLRFASMACGPAREVIDFLKSSDESTVGRCSFVLMDQDPEALLNAKKNLYQVVLERDYSCELVYALLSIKDLLERTIVLKQIAGRKFDLLYTVGLYDYLSQPLARALTQELLNYVAPGGRLLIGNFHPSNPTKAISEFLVDWKMIYRSEEEMMDLVPDSMKASAKVHSDDQDMDLFLEITKPNG